MKNVMMEIKNLETAAHRAANLKQWFLPPFLPPLLIPYLFPLWLSFLYLLFFFFFFLLLFFLDQQCTQSNKQRELLVRLKIKAIALRFNAMELAVVLSPSQMEIAIAGIQL